MNADLPADSGSRRPNRNGRTGRGLDAPMRLGRQAPARYGGLPSHIGEIPQEVRQRSGTGV